jgi:hypothetical protein
VSHGIDETYDIYDENLLKARKGHSCHACDAPIRPGDRYVRVFILFQGEKETVKRCLRCQMIHEYLRGLAPGELWPAERLDCGEEFEEHWGRPPPEAIARLAFLTADESQEEIPFRLTVGRTFRA